MTPCVLWSGAVDGRGYGMVKHPDRNSTLRAHRVAWERERGPMVRDIRQSPLGKVKLSRVYGVSPAQVQRIRAGKQWLTA